MIPISTVLNRLTIEENQLTGTSLVSNYNERIRPILDAVDRLRHLKLMNEGIQLPTIVVVGDQSSGKSSVLESLAGISLPRGEGICTRVPLIMRLQRHSTPHPELFLEYKNKTVKTDEAHISEAISTATDEIAGNGKGISNSPLTLIVRKEGVPDLTMVDLPGITRVPVHGQPEDIYEQISNIIMEHISPNESIILNVLSASVDFPTCESIRMSQKVDKTGERTLAVVTKVDKSPEGLLEKVTADDVNIGLGYVCVRNRIGNETYQKARMEEARLFESHSLLSKLDKSIVGVPVLAQRLVQIQATIIAKCMPDIVRKINEKLTENVSELNAMPQLLPTIGHAWSALMNILTSARDSLTKILVRGEFDDFPEEKNMHCTARMVEMLDQFANDLETMSSNHTHVQTFLTEEINVLNETRGIGLPNFLPRSAFLTILQGRVQRISSTPVEFIEKVWDYIENVVVHVVERQCNSYPQLQVSIKRAATKIVLKLKDQSVEQVKVIVGMEMLADYTCNPDYMSTFNALMARERDFFDALHTEVSFSLVDYGYVGVGHLKEYQEMLVQQAFNLRMRLTAYWKIVLKRLVDSLALHLLFCINNLVINEFMTEIVNELREPNGEGIKRIMDESPSVTSKREKLKNSINLLKEAKEVLSKIMDKIAVEEAKEVLSKRAEIVNELREPSGLICFDS